MVDEWHSKYESYDYMRKQTAQILRYGVAMQYIDNNPMEKHFFHENMRKIVNFTQKRSLIIYWMLLKILA